jgi:hypothetical protein
MKDLIFTKDALRNLSLNERNQCLDKYAEMVKNNQVDVITKLGSHDIRLWRDNDGTINVDMMKSTLDANEALVTRFNKRKKN